MADRYLKHSIIASSLYGLTENGMTLRLQATAQWQKCAAKFLSIPAIILLFGGSLKCLYLSQISTDLHSVKKHLNASVLPQFLSTHLSSSFNFRKVQIWPRTFPLCTVISLQHTCCIITVTAPRYCCNFKCFGIGPNIGLFCIPPFLIQTIQGSEFRFIKTFSGKFYNQQSCGKF